MINANELRIGNWIGFKYTHKGNEIIRHVRVIEIEEDMIINQDGGVRLSLILSGDNAIPIPLTPEILQKAGFKWNKGKKNLELFIRDRQDENIFITVHLSTPFDRTDCVYLYCQDGEPVARTEYLHQLQNIYFALTGSELTLTLQ